MTKIYDVEKQEQPQKKVILSSNKSIDSTMDGSSFSGDDSSNRPSPTKLIGKKCEIKKKHGNWNWFESLTCGLLKRWSKGPRRHHSSQFRNRAFSTGGSFLKQSQHDARDLSIAFCEHTWDLHRVAANFPDSNIDQKHINRSRGLTRGRAEVLLKRNGLNILPKPKEMSNLELFLRQFWNLLWILLIGASVLSFLDFLLDTADTVNLWITLIIFGMIVAMCTVSWYQEMVARKVVMGFQNLLPQTCVVIRDGTESCESAQNLVVGDIIRIRSGFRIAADCRVLLANQLKLESSSITGESEAQDYYPEEVMPNVSIFEAHNVALNGSLCVEGDGFAIVIRTANATVIGQIAEMTTNQGTKKSRLEMQIQKYVIFLVIMAITVATIVFLIGGLVHQWHNIIDLLSKGFLVCAIGMVPCGLPATVSSMLSLIAKRLAKKKVYLKRLDICEALGQVGIIASDKTGTLTKNQMTVVGLWYFNKFVNGEPERNARPDQRRPRMSIANYLPPVSNMLRCMCIGINDPVESHQTHAARTADVKTPQVDATDANKFDFTQTAQSTIRRKTTRNLEKKDTGTPSEMAMARYANGIIDTYSLNLQNPCFEVPFNSRRKWQLAIFAEEEEEPSESGDSLYHLYIKGASEILAKKCTKILDDKGSEHDLDDEAMEAFENAYQTFANKGYRVIGFAETKFRAPPNTEFSLETENFPLTGLTFLGTCAIVDPPRDETAESIRLCREAGIKVFMVTGDHQLTATAIAKQIGLIEEHPNIGEDLHRKNRMRRSMTTSNISGIDYDVIHGERIPQLTDNDWNEIIKKKSVVFARTTPEQKLLIVEQCQRRKQLIAMTGDGVNDAPALKRADIGIAMGSGSEVAKQAADIILMDDNFSSIVRAVKEGRVMYENIKKLLAYTMPHSFPEVWPIIINFCFGFPQGITALQILFIDLGTEILPGVSMAKEKPEADIMRRQPRATKKVLVSNNLLTYSYLYTGQFQSLGCFFAYMCVFWSYGISISDLWMSALNSWQKNGEIFYNSAGRAFSVEEQLYINRQACSAWQMGIVFGQFFNIWCARTRRVSLFKHGLFSNKAMLFALVVEIALISAYVYLPGLNWFLGGAPIPWTCWAVVAAMGLFINFYNEFRKLFIRHYPKNPIVQLIKW